jgi:hypothetical protein
MTRLIIKRHGVLGRGGVGLSESTFRMHLLFFFTGGKLLLVSFDDLDWHRILPRAVEMAFWLGNLGGRWKRPCKKMATGYYDSSLLSCCSIQICVIIGCATLLWHSERSFSSSFFFL